MRSNKNPLMVITKKESDLMAVQKCLSSNFTVVWASDKEDGVLKLQAKRYDFLFIDIALFDRSNGNTKNVGHYREQLSCFWKIYPTVNIVVISAIDTLREAVNIVKAGASDYITRPINPEEVKYVTETIEEEVRIQSELDYLRDQFWSQDSLDVVRTNSPSMKKTLDKIQSVAPTKTTIILYGETGTGKGVFSRLIHRHSNRQDNQFISVHCGAIPDTLIESELFGHEKGAFTGAVKRKLGKFEIAKGGTIFLDEIATISAAAQIKLLNILQDRTFERVGGEETIESDARVIAASNMDIKALCDSGSFRNDLYYRLNVFPIEIPSLKDRKEDIPILVDIFLKQLNQYYTKDIYDVHPMVLEAFNKYSWPGNIRELENLIERSYILEHSKTLTPQSFPHELFMDDETISQIQLDTAQTLAEVRRLAIENIERQYLVEVLTKNNGRINQSAQDSGISSRQLHKLLSKYGIKKEDFKIKRFQT